MKVPSSMSDLRLSRRAIQQDEPLPDDLPETIFPRWEFIRKNLKVSVTHRILDLGCGYGHYSRLLAKLIPNVIGVDIDRDRLLRADSFSRAEKDSNIPHYVQASANHLPFKNNAFDGAICIETIEHLPDDKRAIMEISRTLSEDSHLAVTAPNRLFPFQFHLVSMDGEPMGFAPLRRLRFSSYQTRKVVHWAREYSPSNLLRMLKHNGLETEDVTFIWPSLDRPSQQDRSPFWSKAHEYLPWRQAFHFIGAMPLLKRLGPTIILCARKIKK